MDYCAICSYVEQMIKIVESGKGNGTAALARGLRLLECIAKDQAQTSLHDHATALDIPYATARRMIATLDQSGFVVRVGAGRYRAGPALVGLADVLDLRSLLVILGRKPLRALARSINCVAHLGFWEADMVTYLIKEDSGRLRLFTRENHQLEAYASGIGKVLLAHLGTGERDKFLQTGPFVALTDNTILDPDLLRAEWDKVRRRGFATDCAEVAPELYCVAVPVFGPQGVVAAISLSSPGPIKRPQLRQRIAALRSVSATIAARLNGPGISPV